MCAGPAGLSRPRCYSWTLPSARRAHASNLKRDGVVCPVRAVGLNCSGIRGEFDGAGGAPGTIQSGSMSKSATKAFRGEIGREQKPGISAFLFVCPDSIGAFVADLDKRRRRGPPGGAPRAGRRPRRVFGPDRSSPARADPAALTGQGGGSGPAPSGTDGPGDPCTEAGRVRTRPIPLLLAPR